jgi:hypothetical protein
MAPQYITMAGLVFDIVGGFLVAVEAIKIENLRTMRDRVLKRTNSYILGPRIIRSTNLVFPGEHTEELDKENLQKTLHEEPLPVIGCLPLLTLHVLVGLVFLFLLYLLIKTLTNDLIFNVFLSRVAEINAIPKALMLPINIISGLLMLGLSGAIGSGFFSAFSQLLQGVMKTIDFIEAKTPNGTIGIIGFTFLSLGFLFQFVATYLTIP